MSNSSILAAIDTAIEAIITGTAAHVTIGGVVYSALNLADLRELRIYYAGEAARETALAGTTSGRRFAIQAMSAGDAK
jgi:RsiW-degrading membrane proteinase PrsW (M82 family)